MRENDKYVQSISGHLAQLTNAWQEMWANAANRDVINFFIDAIKTLVNFANAVGVLPTTLTLLLPYINLITKVKSENKKGIVTQFLDWANGLNEAQKAAKAMKEAQEGLNAAQEAGVAIGTAKVASTKAETEANIEGATASAGKTVANEGETASTIELTGAEVGETIAEKGSTAADIEGAAASSGKTAANIAEAGSEAASAAGGFGKLGAAIGGKFVAGIGRITGAVSGLVGAIGIIPTVLGVATGAVLIGKKIYDAHRESVLADAKAVTENIKTQQDAINQQIESYKQLKQQLDSGDLSEQETITVKQQIYDIQKQITEEYGGAARGVDLINGKLEEQVALLNSISQKEALSLYNKNYEGFGIAIDEYTKNRKYGFSLSSGSKVVQDALTEAGLNIYGSGSGTFMAQVKDDAEGSIKSLEKARANLEKLQSEYKNTDTAKIIDNEIKKIDKAISDAYEDADEYRDEALKGLQLKLLSKDQEGYDTYQNYQSSVSNLENAYASGDTKKINEARKAFDEATKAKEDFFEIKGNEQFTLLFDQIDTSLIDTKNKFRDTVELLKDIPQPDSEEGLFETEYTKRIDKNTKAKKKNGKETDKVHKAAEKLYKLNPDKVDIKATLDNNTYASGKYADALNTLMNEMGWTTAEADEMINALVTAGIVHGDASDIAYIATDSYNVFSSSVENAVAAVNSLNTALSESAKGTGLTEQTLTELRNAFGDNLDSVLEKTANGYHLNTEGAYLLRQQQEALVSADYASAIYEQYQALDKLQEGYNRAKEAGEDTSGFAQQRKAIQDNIDKLNEQLMTFNNANSAYQTWLAKQSSEGEREMYNSIYSGYDAVKDELDRGWAGEKTRSWLDLIFNDENDDSFDAWISSAEEVKEKFEEVTKDIEGTGGYSIADFFTVDGNGKSTSLGVWNFFDAIENKQKEVGKEFIKIGKDGEKIFDFTKNGDYQIADLLGMDIESVHAVLRAAADAGFEVHLDQPLFSLEQLTEKATAAKKALEETSGTKLKINLDPQSEDEVDSAMQKLTDYQQVLSEDTSIDPKVKTEKLQQLADIMNFLAAKKREFVEGKVFDIKLLDSKELEKSKKDINDITNKLFNYSKTSGKTEFADQFTIDPMLLNDVDYLQSKMETLKEIQPNVDDTQVQYLDQLLAQLQYRINILNDSNIGETITVDQLMAAEQIVDDINTKLDYAAQHKDIEFNWDADEEFKEDLNTIANLPEDIKQKWGIEPDATGEELLELAKKGELHINVEATGNVPKKEDFQPSTPQEGTTITNTKIEELKYNVSGAMDTTVFDQGKQHVQQGIEELNQKTAEPKAGLDNNTFIEKQNDSFVALEKLDDYNATPNVTLTGLGGVESVAESMKSTISSIKGKTVDVVVNATSNGLASLKERVQGAINKINELKNKKVDFANGTAHAYGTAFARGSVISGSAFASGDWGTSKDQTALTGELGTEIVVFPDGHWQTVGDTGAEFVHLPKGSIVFNHKQSEELLENGYVTSNKGRGKLVGFASGTAFSYGNNKGAIKPTKSSKGMGNSTTSSSNKGGSNNRGSNNNRRNNNNNNNNNKDANKTKNTLDEVEILIARIERQIANLDKTISSTYKTWTTRNNAIKSDLAKVAQEIKDQNKAYTTYIKKANSVGLSAAWKKKVQSGKFKIEDVTDDKLWQKIQDYKQW